MKFFVGVHHPNKAGHVPLAMVSANALRKRRSHFPVNEWILDSGAFTTLAKHGYYPEPVDVYAALIRRFANCGTLVAAVTQDYMCEPVMLAKTGLDVLGHQHLTILRYDSLVACDTGGVPIMPVLQGYEPSEYVDHIHQYGNRLTEGMWVGVGSVCKRNRNVGSIRAVLDAILAVRPDLRLHGFGIKTTALRDGAIRAALYSADSMAWSFAARRNGRDSNDIGEAVRFVEKIRTQSVQQTLLRVAS